MDFSGPKIVPTKGGARYISIGRDDFTRYGNGYFIVHQSDDASAFKKVIADARTDG